ncbi:MAG: TonB-dependent receptor [Bacteroidaceae bacterium]|nr:TonB-dependent receptor [Bacteroidaceae bacterium]
MKKRIVLFMTCLFVMIGLATAQTRVQGTVTSAEDGEPIVGATVLVKGTTVGTVTDIDGKFVLTGIPSSAKTLVISYVGMKTQEVAIRSSVRVSLASDAEVLDDVIVVAYGTAKKSSFTGSAANVDNKKLEMRPITSVTNGLEGQATGVLMTSASGQPGSTGSIRIRGYGSINASSAPLYVVDGIPFDGSLSSINPSDIESMTILKDASAGALYGARGANGVVMITTKQGKEGKTNVTWRSTVGWSERAQKPYDMLNQKEFVQLSYEAIRNGLIFNSGYSWADAEAAARASLGGSSYLGGSAGEQYNPFKNYSWSELIDPATGLVRDDAKSVYDEQWMDNLLRTGFRQEHQMNVNGGTEKTKYMISLGYLNEDGILKTTGFERYTGRANVNTQVNDWFQANLNIGLSQSRQNYSDYDGSSTSNPWYSSQFVSPLFPVYLRDAAGNIVNDEFGKPTLDYGETGRPGSYNDFNPLGGLTLDKAKIQNDGASVRTGVTFGGDSDKLGAFKGLKLQVNFGADYRNTSYMGYMNMYHGNQANAGGYLEKESTRTLSYTLNQLLTYTRSFGRHNLDVLAGHEYYSYHYQNLDAAKTNLVDGIYELRPATTTVNADSYSNDYRIESWMGRINYNFDDKYYLSASVRTDGSSRFHKDNRWGTFWSVGANWRVTKEAFMQNVSWVNNLNVKASYGEQGNDELGTLYAWQSLYSLSYANGNNIGGFVASLENKDISWEKNANLNVGIEASLFDNRVRLNAEYYNKKTKDMLLNYPMATSTGFNGYDANVGDMRNSGFEVELGLTPVRIQDFEWNLTWMGSTVNNKVLHLTKESPEIISGIRIIKEGYELNTFYMAKSAGVDPQTGAQLYWAYDKDDNGNITNEYITSDVAKASTSKYFLGSRIPDLYGSIGTDLTWKGLTLSVLTTYSIGGKIYDSLYAGSMNNMYYNNNWNRHALRRWTQPGDVTDVPRIEVGGKYATSDRFLVDASYFAIKNVTLSYSLPRTWMRSAGLNAVRLFGSVDNLALFTHLQGMDPQYSFSGGTNYDYTPNRTYSVGIEVNF